jgi:Vps16, N-terminal region
VTDIPTTMANPTADWEKVGDKFYRKIQLYTAVFDQDLELENYIVTGCSYGGAIGMPLLSTVEYMHESSWKEMMLHFAC